MKEQKCLGFCLTLNLPRSRHWNGFKFKFLWEVDTLMKSGDTLMKSGHTDEEWRSETGKRRKPTESVSSRQVTTTCNGSSIPVGNPGSQFGIPASESLSPPLPPLGEGAEVFTPTPVSHWLKTTGLVLGRSFWPAAGDGEGSGARRALRQTCRCWRSGQCAWKW